jgi:hypothetical protein
MNGMPNGIAYGASADEPVRRIDIASHAQRLHQRWCLPEHGGQPLSVTAFRGTHLSDDFRGAWTS